MKRSSWIWLGLYHKTWSRSLVFGILHVFYILDFVWFLFDLERLFYGAADREEARGEPVPSRSDWEPSIAFALVLENGALS